jgi:flavoprotein
MAETLVASARERSPVSDLTVWVLTAGLDGAIVERMPQIDIKEDPAKCEACLCAAAPNADLGDRVEAIQRAFCIGVSIALIQGPLEGSLSFCPKHFAAMRRLLVACNAVGNRDVPSTRRASS